MHETQGSHVPRTLTVNATHHGTMLEAHMKTYKYLTLLTAILITAVELFVFTRASVIAPQVEALRAAAAPQAATVITPSVDQTEDAGAISGE